MVTKPVEQPEIRGQVRFSVELRQKVRVAAALDNVTMQEYIEGAVLQRLRREGRANLK